jgi:hypothetical protein
MVNNHGVIVLVTKKDLIPILYKLVPIIIVTGILSLEVKQKFNSRVKTQ